MTRLSTLAAFTAVEADTGDFQQFVTFAPRHALINPSLVSHSIGTAAACLPIGWR